MIGKARRLHAKRHRQRSTRKAARNAERYTSARPKTPAIATPTTKAKMVVETAEAALDAPLAVPEAVS